MSDLAEFLLARIADTELECDLFGTGPEPSGRIAALLRRQCGAMRLIVALRESIDQEVRKVALTGPAFAASTGVLDMASSFRATRHALDQAIKIHAMTFADHPDFRPEWRP